jgi:aminoglycoside phosphotransferase (APT) family kinase protein
MDDEPAAAHAWEPERVVHAADAAHLVGEQFPGLRGAPVEPLATGWDNTIMLVGGQWCFRFPRRAVAVPGVEREAAVLPRLAEHLPLPVPVPELIGRPSGDYPWPFWGARLIPGRELPETGLPDAERARAAEELGGFLRALHDPALVAVAGPGLPRDPMHRADPAVRAPMARDQLARLARHGIPAADPAVARLLADAAELGPPTGTVAVCHGDLHARHVLVDEDGAAAGVIDWGDLCLADPAVDLSVAYGAFSGPARAALLSAYGPVEPEREIRARVLAISLCAALADYAASTGRARLLDEARIGIRRAQAD